MSEEEERKEVPEEEEEHVDDGPTQEEQATVEYLEKTNMKEVINKAVNELLESRPVDVFGVLSLMVRRLAFPPTIDHLQGREILDSRGNPTVECDVYVKYMDEVILGGRSSAPSGASTGSNEAKELRDAAPQRYAGKGTINARRNVTEPISEALAGKEISNLRELDQIMIELDGTDLKEKLGGNATTATSFALATAGAAINNEELFLYLSRQFNEEVPKKFRIPTPFFNILNGGKHAGGKLKIQEFMIAPRSDISFPEQLRMATEVYHILGKILIKECGVSAKNLGDEGGYAPEFNNIEQALSAIERAVQVAGYEIGKDIRLALDAAATEFYNPQNKMYEIEAGVLKNGDDMVAFWSNLIEKHPAIISIEDPFAEKDYDNWIKLNNAIGNKVQIVGDDLYTTNPKTIQKGLDGKWCNALLLKVNQIGTISEAMNAARLIFNAQQTVMVSHRSGETCNSLIADLSVAIGAQCIKTGSTARGERIQKYTRFLQIYDYLKERNMLAD